MPRDVDFDHASSRRNSAFGFNAVQSHHNRAHQMAKGITRYSERIEGAIGNYKWLVRFDVTDGYLGISQMEDNKVKDRVLLSPKQVKAMNEFIQPKARSR